MVMQFMAGILSEKKDNKFMEKLLKLLQLEERDRDGIPISVKCLVEYEDKDFAKNIIKKHPPLFMIDRFQNLTDVDCISVSFLLDVFCELNKEASKKPQPSTGQVLCFVEKLSIRFSNLTPSGVRRICKSLEKEFCAVRILWLIHCGLNDECLDCMSELVASRITG